MNKSRLFCARTAGRQWMRYFLMLACLLLLIAGRAQTYPVQVTTTLIPPYSPVLSYYTSADANNLQVIIHVMELDRTDLRAKLRVTIEGAGVRLYTSPAYVPPALVLQGGVPEMLSGFDIRGYLNPNNLIFEGITRAEFIKSGKLPEGFYTFTIEVLEYNRSVRISNQSRANAWVVLNDPPLINFPFSGDKLRTTDPQNISFSWVGRHLASPNSAFSTEYEFTLYELYPGQTNPEVAVRSSNSIYRTTTTQSSLYYGPAEPQLIPGKKYAYRIRAYDVSGRDLFKNQGYSETNWFQYGDACLPLRSVTAEALDPSRIRISWEPEATHTGFVVSHREAGTDTWWKETTFSTSLVIPDLKRGTAYEYQVMGQCNQYEGETSTIQTISTEEEETEDPNFACGTDLIMPELSPNPLQKPLLPLDLFHIGGLDVVVHSVTLNADGSYSGMGHAPMPIFNGAGMRVKIRNVIINEDYYAIAGSVVTVYDTEGRFIVGNTDDLKGDLSEEDAPEDTTTTDTPDDNLLAVEGDIGSVEVIDGELVVTDVDGNPIDIGTVELPVEGETLTIEDASGDTWVVDAEGNVTPGTGNGGSDPNTPGAVSSEVELDYVVTFSPSENQTYGFDKKTQPTLGGYNQTQLNGENHWVAWKSVESGRTDQVQVSVADQDEFPDYIGFKTPTGTIPSQTGKDKHTRELTLSGLMAGNPTTLTAFATQEDEEGNATEVTMGRLDVVAYDMERQKVVIVPVNDARTPDANALYESLNKIYAQAVAQWEVVVDHSYSVEPEVLRALDEGESGLFASFPKNMKQFQKDFKKSRDTDKDAYYLFLIPGSGARAGFMPFKRQYGYIWTGSTGDLPRTIAHELAHGAFRLRHTFSPEAFIATQGSTDNLMDYLSAGAGSSGATHLYKHQWDNVHNPEGVTSWLQDDEESAYVAMSEEEFDYFFAEVEPLMADEDSEVKETIKKLKEIYEFFEKCNDENWASYDGQGVIPYCFWRDAESGDLPFTAGIVDGAYLEYEAITQLVPMIEDLHDNISKVIAAYTIDSWRCRDEALVSNSTEYERVLQRLKELEGESSVWSWVEERWQEDSKQDLEDFFKECEEVQTLKNDINELYVFITDFEEVIDLYFEIESKITEYLETLQSDGNEGYYERGRLVIPAATVLIDGVGVLSKMPRVKKALQGMKKLIKDDEWFKFANRLDVSGAWKSGWSEERVLDMAKGSRPNPASYLDADYINGHLAKFDEASTLTFENSINTYEQIGRDDGLFILPKSEMDKLIAKTRGDVSLIEKELGIPEGLWTNRLSDPLNPDRLIRVDISNPKSQNLRMATGREDGANELWFPGGKTPQGHSEAVIDFIPTKETSLYSVTRISQ